MNQAATITSAPTQIDELLSAITHHEAAKANLDRARAVMAEAEGELLTLLGHKPEGSFTVVVNDQWKVTTTGKLNRKLLPNFAAIRSQIPPALLNRLVRTKEELNVRELKFIENNEPEIYAYLAQAIEIKPAKASVEVKRI